MQWTRLTPIGIEDWMPQKLRTATEELNEKINQVLEGRKRCQQHAANVSGADIAEADFNNLVGYAAFRVTFLETLQAELLVRRELAGYWESYHEGLTRAARKAADAHKKVQDDVRTKLIAIGYHAPSDPADPCALQPVFFQRHPKVREALQRMQDLRSRTNDKAGMNENEAAMTRISAKLQSIRERSLSS